MANTRCQHHTRPKLVANSTLLIVSGSSAAAAEPAILAVTPSIRLNADSNATIEPNIATRQNQASNGVSALAEVEAREPTPEFAAMMEEELERLLDRLGDDTLRQIAVGKMAGYTEAEIAGKLSLGLRTVERKLSLIRNLWLAGEPD